ncbi:MAG: ATP-dependent DNA helicase PcrA, partial [Thermodesulfobacteriota bacterium]
VGMTRAKERLFLSRAEERSTFGVGRANLPSRFLDELPMESLQLEQKRGRIESLFSQDNPWRDDVDQTRVRTDDLCQETFSEGSGITLSPEGFFQLKVGMRVRHPKFGQGKVTSVEGIDEDQKATIFFGNVGPKRLKVRYANLEILQ